MYDFCEQLCEEEDLPEGGAFGICVDNCIEALFFDEA